MNARFASNCPACRTRIQKGAPIVKSGRRYVHERCGGFQPTAYQQGDHSPGAIASHYDRRGVYTASGEYLGTSGPRCEDAPCCGCCS